MIDYLDEARFESAQNEIDLVGLITKRLCSDAAEYAYRHQRAKEVLSLMPDDFEPDNRWPDNVNAECLQCGAYVDNATPWKAGERHE